MAFFKRDLSPVQRFEAALKTKQAERSKLADRLSLAESVLGEKRAVAERLAVAGASNAKLERADATLRTVEDRAKTLRAALAELDAQIASNERALSEARAQRERETRADQIEQLAAAIEQALPRFAGGAAALVEVVAGSAVTIAEAAGFSASVDAVRREVLSAADLVCWELRALAVRTRVGNVNVPLLAPPVAAQPRPPEIERQSIYTLNALLWREGGVVRKAPAFALVELPKTLLPVALRYQHVDHLNARRVQTLMHVHGSDALEKSGEPDEAQCVDLDALAADEQSSTRADVA
ncbi:hypothetical protein [Bradyrhizobium sp. Tv2a-2]|uniref:hypothetical protein n=1 Tax=Bradyrhizobium sp. Tv2a-2 TaxID=113395 RepID=UPI000429821A|nr:hypothetical protein [Bradyrhizobium sp. Tv2a-2]